MVKKLLLHCTLLLSISVFGNVAHALTIKIGHNDTPYDAATAALVKVVFERSGYNVSETKGDSEILLSMLDRGEIDFYLSAWLPTRDAESYAPYETNLKLITALYDDASSFFAVPRYIPRSMVNTVEDLTKLEIIEKMNKQIILDDQDKILTKQAQEAVAVHNLGNAGYELTAMPSSEWDAHVEKKLEDKIWFFTPMTKLHRLNLTKKFRAVKGTKDVFKQKDTAWLVGNKKTEKKIATHIFEIISKMELSTKWVAEINQMAFENDWPHYVAARVWMASHPYTVEYWISGE
jgi:glycine betaine/proline transport system substrate-binding protein